jgi:4-aminobutyrate aminotransferase-like enzyme
MSASTTYGGNPMACAAGLATLEVFEEEKILENVNKVGAFIIARMQKMKESHKIIGDARGKGLLLAIDLVKDRTTREPFTEAGNMVYEKAFARGLAWIPAGNILRLAPPLVITEELAGKAMDIVDEAIGETEKHFGY